MVSGEWTGTMNLTEPQAGSDLALVKTRAEPQPDGTFRIFGTKIFITFGEHDFTGTSCIWCFSPPARRAGGREGYLAVSLCRSSWSTRWFAGCPQRCTVRVDRTQAGHSRLTRLRDAVRRCRRCGWLRGGEVNRGLEYMFVMMNLARFGVGLRGRGYRRARLPARVAFARERVQSRDVGAPKNPSVPIIRHPDVRRMLLRMRAQTGQHARWRCHRLRIRSR